MDAMITDKLGNKLSVGDFVAYGVRVGNRGALHIGRVEEARDRLVVVPINRGDWDRGKPKKGRRSTLSYPEQRVAKITLVPQEYLDLFN